MCWSGCSLLVDDLKADAALLSSVLSGGRGRLPEATGYRHRRTMHVPCTPTLTLADISARQSDRHESFDQSTRTATLLDVARHRPRCAAAARRSESSAARRRRRPRLLTTADGRGAPTSTLGTLERCQRPRSASPADLLLVLETRRPQR